MKINLDSLEKKENFYENWTISIEMKVSALPQDSLALLQCHADPTTVRNTVEAELSGVGSVGIFDSVPNDLKTNLQAEKWQMVTLRYGGSRRSLDVFVNGKKSQTISKPLFDTRTKGGRFAVPKDGFLLFATRKLMARAGLASDVNVRYVQFTGRALSDQEIRSSKRSSVWSQWQRDIANTQQEMWNNLALKPLYKRPPFVWQEQAYICEFGDAVVGSATGQPGVYGSLRVVEFVASQMHEQQQGALDMLTDSESAILAKSMNMLKESLQVARMYQLSTKNPNQMIAFIRKFRKKLDSLALNACFMVPGAFNNKMGYSPFVVMLEKTEATKYRFTLINTGDQGIEYHYSSATSAPPKIQTRQTMVFENVEAKRVLDDGWWLMFWRLGLGAKQNTPEKLYNDLLPLLLDKPLDVALEENNNHNNLADVLAPLRTQQRSPVTGYRVLREAWTYYLLQHGVTPDHTLQVHNATHTHTTSPIS